MLLPRDAQSSIVTGPSAIDKLCPPLVTSCVRVRDGVRQSPADWSICQSRPSCETPTLGLGTSTISQTDTFREICMFARISFVFVVSLITFCRSSSRDRSIMTYRLELNPSDHRQVLSNFLQVKGAKYDQSSAFFTFPSNWNVQKWTEEHSPDLKLVPSDGSDPVEAPSLHLFLHSPTLRLVRQSCFGTCDSWRIL